VPIKIPRAKKREEEEKPVQKGAGKFGFRSPRGMHDILPGDFLYRDKIEKSLRDTADAYMFEHIDTPIAEQVGLFERGTGTTSEVVEKQMFFIKGGGADALALRPEMTPGVMRAYIQSGLFRVLIPGKFFYYGPMFRHERPQAGRLRQLWQAGFEILGSSDAVYDAQIIVATFRLLSGVKIKNLVLKVNSIGCKTCRTAYVKKLKDYYRSKTSKLCKDCQRRYRDNPLRMLDCKESKCASFKESAPMMLDSLCGSCKSHFKTVLELLDSVGISYVVDPLLVRGLDYYSRTVFEIFSEGIDFALAGGGRYDYLSLALGGPKITGVGSAAGVDRIMEVMKIQNIAPQKRKKVQVFLVYMGEQAKRVAFRLVETLNEGGISVAESFSKESLKAQLRSADREEAPISLIIGQREVFEDVVILRNMKTGNQETIPMKKVVEVVKKRLR